MLTSEQKDSIMSLYKRGVNITEIAKKVHVSRHSVYRTIHSDIDEDAEVHALKKRLEKAKLQRSIKEVREPFTTDLRVDKLYKTMDKVVSKLLALWSLFSIHADLDVDLPQYCPYCDSELKYREVKNRDECLHPQYFCHECRKAFPSP